MPLSAVTSSFITAAPVGKQAMRDALDDARDELDLKEFATNMGLTTAGTSSVYTITTGKTLTSLNDGQCFLIRPHVLCAAAARLSVDGITSKPFFITYNGGVDNFTGATPAPAAVAAGEINLNQPVSVQYDLANDRFVLLNVHRSLAKDALAPPGDNVIVNGGMQVFLRGSPDTLTALATGGTIAYANMPGRWFQQNNVVNLSVRRRRLGTAASPIYGGAELLGTGFDSQLEIGGTGMTPGAASLGVFGTTIRDASTFTGKACTLAFIGASSASSTVIIEIEQNFGSGGSPSAVVRQVLVTQALTTTATQYNVAFTMPSISGKTIGTNNDSYLRINFWVIAGSNYNARLGSTLTPAAANVMVTGVSLRQGQVFAGWRSEDYATTLAKCHAYYYADNFSLQAYNNVSNANTFTKLHPVPMARLPTIVPTTTSLSNVFSAVLDSVTTTSLRVYSTPSITGATVFEGTYTADAEYY